MRIAVIGGSDMITGFGLIGVKDLYEVCDETSAVREAFVRATSDKEIGLLVISSPMAGLIREQINKFNQTKKIVPVIIEVPDKHGAPEEDPFEELIKKAVGVSI
ncbi:MAG TPA: V-type ATP synthase subunit F [Candidatus Methanofastidiosa archaeon]|nr:V-type ATP synthase subunit F [Candidatus Methanofastidiosa archaeon]